MEEISNSLDAIRSSLPIAYLVVMPMLILAVSPVSVVNAAHEFTAYRMQQYDLGGVNYGCQHSVISSEARTFESASYERRCVLIKSNDLTVANYNRVLQDSPTSIVILINNNMTDEQAKSLMEIEEDLLRSEPRCPVYFANEDEDLDDIYSKVTKATATVSSSAAQSLVDQATFIGYHLTSSGASNAPMPDHSITNIQGVLLGLGVPEKLPTIAIVAHYDSFGIAPMLSYGANSDASGVVALLEIARVLGKLYSDPKTHPKYNVLFLLAGGGKFNYFGSRRWIEDALESSAYSNLHYSTSLLSSTRLVLCLDTLANMKNMEGKQEALHMHVSKPPKPGSVAHTVHSNIEKSAENQYKQINTSIVHKKISINAETSAWEHEKYSKRRFHAVTLSTLSSWDSPLRRSIMDRKEYLSPESLTRNTRMIARSIIHTIYNIDQESATNLMDGDFVIQKERVNSWLDFLSAQSRSQQQMGEDHIVVSALKKEMSQYLTPANVHTSKIVADKRDPEYLFYSGLKIQINASVVRSAIFDLYLTVSIFSYVAVIYLLVVKFDFLLAMAKNYGAIQKVKTA